MKRFKTAELFQRQLAYYNRASDRHVDGQKPKATVLDTLQHFQSGLYGDTIKAARAQIDKTGADKKRLWASLKADLLPAIVFGYQYGQDNDMRKAANASDPKRFTNLMVLDWDRGEKTGNLKTNEDRADLKTKLSQDPHILAVFNSPGRGLKALTVVSAETPSEYKECFIAAQRYFNGKFEFRLDGSGKDVSRLCFICSDKNAYIADPSIKSTIEAFACLPGTSSNGTIVRGKAEDVGLSTWNRRATKQETEMMVSRLNDDDASPGERHNHLFSWVINARALGLTQEDASTAATAWLEDNGRSPAANEIENFWRDAEVGLYDGTKVPRMGVRADVDFGVNRLFRTDGTPYDAQRTDSQAVANEDGSAPADLVDPYAWLETLVKTPKGDYKACAVNRRVFAQNHPDILAQYKYDVFADKLFSENSMACAIEYASKHTMVVSDGQGEIEVDALVDSGMVNFDSLIEHITGLPEWDGTKRLDTWLIDYAFTEDTPFVRAVCRRFILSMIARALVPGIKMDTTLILEGRQGTGKSTLAATLAGNDKWFTDSFKGTHVEDLKKLRGKWVVEMSELSGEFLSFSKQEAVKAMMSTQADQYRASYGKRPIDVPRRCVFIGTTNKSKNDGYMRDDSGNRRYWPVEVCTTSEGARIDIRGIKKVRDQIFAEALQAYKNGEKWWLTKEEDSVQATEANLRREPNPFEEGVEHMLQDAEANGKNFVRNAEVFEALHLDVKDSRSPYTSRQLVPLFQAHGWKRGVKRVNAKVHRGYHRVDRAAAAGKKQSPLLG